MKLTSPLSVSKLIAAIHPPLPPSSARESKQLLNILDTAFRRHLDDIHPSPNRSPSNAKDRDASIPDPASATTTATHAHLDAVLNHPMLRSRLPHTPPNLSARAAVLAKFDAALLKNQVTPEFVAWQSSRYMEAFTSTDKTSPSATLAPRIASWFTSLPGTQKRNFLADGKVLHAVVPVLYADGLESEVWTWLRILYERDFGTVAHSLETRAVLSGSNELLLLKAEDYLVSLMIGATLRQNAWDDAARQFIQAYRHRSQSPHNLNLTFSRHRLVSAVIQRRQTHQISAPVFDDLLQALSTGKRSFFSAEALAVYHPTMPSASGLRKLLAEQPVLSTWTKRRLSRTAHHEILIAVLDAAQLFVVQGNLIHAREILNFAEANYPDVAALKKDVDVVERLETTRQEVHIPAHPDLEFSAG